MGYKLGKLIKAREKAKKKKKKKNSRLEIPMNRFVVVLFCVHVFVGGIVLCLLIYFIDITNRFGAA